MDDDILCIARALYLKRPFRSLLARPNLPGIATRRVHARLEECKDRIEVARLNQPAKNVAF